MLTVFNIFTGGWVDAFEALGRPAECKATCYWLRLDRAFLYTPPAAAGAARPSSTLAAAGMVLVGKAQGPLLQGRTYTKASGKTAKLPPSDHRGLLVSVAYKPADRPRASPWG